jgi:DNA adenine methylase
MVAELKSLKPTRPVLRYHGGKWLLAEWIIQHFPAHRVYVEPFGGGASVLLQKPRAYSEVYNDLDGELVSLFRVLRDPAQARELRRLLELTLYARAEFEAAYASTIADPIESARRLIVRSFMGIGCSALTHAPGKSHTGFRSVLEPNGGLRARGWATFTDNLTAIVERMRGVVVEQMPAAECVAKFDSPKSLIYCDPPYPKSTRKDAGDDYRHEMTDDDHRELAGALRTAKGMVIVSGYPCELYDSELFVGWHRVERTAFADKAQKRTEVLWINTAASRASRTPLFDTPECGAGRPAKGW